MRGSPRFMSNALKATDLPQADRHHAIALALTQGIGPKTLTKLLARFGTLAAILNASPAELQEIPGIGSKTAAAIRAIDLSAVATDLSRFENSGISVLLWSDAAYPSALRGLNDAPLIVFVRGHLDESPRVAIVGTREPSQASIDCAESLATDFASQGWTVVSGMARGIDSAAHRGALAAGGRTVAVLGCGVSRIYPPENHELARQIVANGALLSEFHPDRRPAANLLTIRNRVISGLSRAVIVVEAGETSGSLYAARRAHAQGRLVFAIPNGSIGNQKLLTDFAQPLESAAEAIATIAGHRSPTSDSVL